MIHIDDLHDITNGKVNMSYKILNLQLLYYNDTTSIHDLHK
jgi:hypothetical protein